MSETQIQLKNVEEIENECEFGKGKLMVDLDSEFTKYGNTQRSAHPNWRMLKRAKRE
jgi:hypothetical protein